MNLINGKQVSQQECDAMLDQLDQMILHTLSKEPLDPHIVIAACDQFLKELDETAYLQTMQELGIQEALGKQYIEEARQQFSAQRLHKRLVLELGTLYKQPQQEIPHGKPFAVAKKLCPLGVLFHIAAGNADALPAFSILEGLLTGNINLLKLPSQEGGFTVQILQELIHIEPRLAEYIYVFDYSSKDIMHMNQFIALSDAVIVWGSAEAVSSLRKLVPAHIKIIEWGHKVSFAYVTKQGIAQYGLEGLARNIAKTGQLLCSSIQGIFLDTESMEEVHAFCDQFLPILEQAIAAFPQNIELSTKYQIALSVYQQELEAVFQNSKVFKGKDCSIIAYADRVLDTAIQHGNVWVKALPSSELLPVLRPYKNFLQTVGMLCGEQEYENIAQQLLKTGVVRICPPQYMSETYFGAPHDGEYTLRRYMKIATTEQEQ